MKTKIKVLKEERAFDSYFKVDKGIISEKNENGEEVIYDRFKLTRADAVAVLIFNEDNQKVTLVKQFRYPIAHHTNENILEVVAGKIDKGETPKQAAIREVFEEVGYKIEESGLSNPIKMFASPGYSTEVIYIFLAVVKKKDKILNAGGGLATEHENIEIIEMDLSEFMNKVHKNLIQDSKTIIASNLIKI